MKKFFFSRQSSRGQTLIETLFAVAILTIAIVDALVLLTQVTSSAARARDQFIAANLAQEGIELVQNIRTTNWVRNQDWLTNLSVGTFCSDFINSPPALRTSATSCPLFLNTSNMYVQASGNSTPFSRLITLANGIDGDGKVYLDVQSKVTWESGVHAIVVEDRLYNWK